MSLLIKLRKSVKLEINEENMGIENNFRDNIDDLNISLRSKKNLMLLFPYNIGTQQLAEFICGYTHEKKLGIDLQIYLRNRKINNKKFYPFVSCFTYNTPFPSNLTMRQVFILLKQFSKSKYIDPVYKIGNLVSVFNLEGCLNENIFKISRQELKLFQICCTIIDFSEILIFGSLPDNLTSIQEEFLANFLKKAKSRGRYVLIIGNKLPKNSSAFIDDIQVVFSGKTQFSGDCKLFLDHLDNLGITKTIGSDFENGLEKLLNNEKGVFDREINVLKNNSRENYFKEEETETTSLNEDEKDIKKLKKIKDPSFFTLFYYFNLSYYKCLVQHYCCLDNFFFLMIIIFFFNFPFFLTLIGSAESIITALISSEYHYLLAFLSKISNLKFSGTLSKVWTLPLSLQKILILIGVDQFS